MRLIEARIKDSDRLVYFNQEFVSAFGVHQSGPFGTWIECAGEEYHVSCTVQDILRQIPAEAPCDSQ